MTELPNNWEPRPYQLKAWQYLEHGGRHAELIWHRRSGKDEVALHRTACAMVQRVAGYWHMLPEASQARKAIWEAVNPRTGRKRIDEAFPLELRKTTRSQEMYLEFKNGSSWQVVGSDNYDSLVGSTPAGIVYSEWALANPAARAYLRPIIAENNGWQMFVTTPRGKNHAHTTYKAAQRTPGAFAQILSAEQTGLFTAEQLESERAQYIADFGQEYGQAKYEQEYLCSFDAALLGAILGPAVSRAERSGRITDAIDFDPRGSSIHISADIGRRDTSAWWFWQPTVGGYHLFDYDDGWGMDADEWCDRLIKKLNVYHSMAGKNPLAKIWLPHDARAKTFAAKHSAVEIFIKRFGADKVAITPPSSIPDRINAGRKIIERCAFNETKCTPGLEGLRSWAYEYDDERKMFGAAPIHDWASHPSDAFTYGCLIMQMTQPKPEKEKAKFFNDQTAFDLFDLHPEPKRARI